MSRFDDILNNITPHKKHPNDRVLLVDGLNIFLRTFAINGALNDKGVIVGGIIGFLKSLALFIRNLGPTRIIIVYDGKGGSLRRKKINPDYKSKRTPKRITKFDNFGSLDDEQQAMKIQFVRLLSYLELLPLSIISIDYIEADDIIAYIAQNLLKNEVIIASSDEDFLQLVNNRISVWSPNKKKLYTPSKILEDYGVSSPNFLLYRMLTGDKSDNLKGIQGLGPKKIPKLIPEMVGDEIDLSYILEKSKNQKNLMYQRIWEGQNLLEINEKMMSLKNPLMSPNFKYQIQELESSPPNKLDKINFTSLYYNDYMGDNIPNLNIWLTEHFSHINNLNHPPHG